MIERYFISYRGFPEEKSTMAHGGVVINLPHKLETAKQMQALSNRLAKEAGYPVVILSLYHMCTVSNKEEE